MPDILVTETISGEAMAELESKFQVTSEPALWRSPQRLIEMLPEFAAIIVRNQTKVDRRLISAGRRLRVIGRAGVGLDNIDVPAASEAGVVVCYTPEQNSLSVAELAIGLMLSLARRLPAADRATRGGAWDRAAFTGTELFGKTLGLVGFGRIGFLTAMRARAFGMEILAHDPQVSPDAPSIIETRARLVSLEDLLERSDFVSAHVPKTPATAGLFNYPRLSRMKPTAYLINTARGRVVDEPGLIRALRERKLAGAALDVRATEPPKAPGELEAMDNVILLPHVGAFTREGQQRVVSCVCRDVQAVLEGRPAGSFANFACPQPINGRRVHLAESQPAAAAAAHAAAAATGET